MNAISANLLDTVYNVLTFVVQREFSFIELTNT